MKVLVVDDDELILKDITDILEHERIEFISSSGVNEAIEAISAHKFDAVITDIIMPEKTGVDLISFIKKKNPELPIIAMTGGILHTKEDYVNYVEKYADATIIKPILRSELLDAIDSVRSGKRSN